MNLCQARVSSLIAVASLKAAPLLEKSRGVRMATSEATVERTCSPETKRFDAAREIAQKGEEPFARSALPPPKKKQHISDEIG